jgi:hypothetical protein
MIPQEYDIATDSDQDGIVHLPTCFSCILPTFPFIAQLRFERRNFLWYK